MWKRARTLPPRRGNEAGAAMIVVLLLTLGIAAIAMSTVFLSSSVTVRTLSYQKEREFRLATEAALGMGRFQLIQDTSLVLPDTGFVTLLGNVHAVDAEGAPISGVKVSVYAARTRSSSGEPGTFASVVAEARDVSGARRYVRRLELVAENFARFGMFTNRWFGGCYDTGEFIRGLGHSNQNWVSCGSPVYFDTITAAGSVIGGSPSFRKGALSNASVIPLPSEARLASLHDHAAGAHFDINAAGTSLSDARTRLEFVAIDLNDDGDLTDADEGFFRVFQADDPSRARAEYRAEVRDDQCGDWHDADPGEGVDLKFFPVGVHDDPWYHALRYGDAARAIGDVTRHAIMRGAGSRCFPAGDPHLVATERAGVGGYIAADWQKGGDDTTFTAGGNAGSWIAFGGVSPAILSSIPDVRQAAEAPYLWPLSRALNAGSKGVIHVHGPVLLGGALRGRVTLHASGEVGFVDDLVYTQDPAAVLCANLLGVIADGNALILDNGINSPQAPNGAYLWTDDNHDWIFHGVIMSRTGTVGVERWRAHPESMKQCNGVLSGRGCILQAGGVIQNVLSPSTDGAGSGFGENRSVDACMLRDAPPYFPTTGRYTDNRYYELDPARFRPRQLFATLQEDF